MVYIVIVNWKCYEDTIECLESLMLLQRVAFRIIVIDNESSDKGLQKIDEWASGQSKVARSGEAWRMIDGAGRALSPTPCVKIEQASPPTNAFVNVLPLEENTGFAHANNLGLDIALRDPACELVWLLNNDTIVDPLSLWHMVQLSLKDSNVGICGSTLLYYDTPDVVQSVGGRFNAYIGKGRNIGNGLSVATLGETLERMPQPQYIVGASMLVTRQFLLEIGFLSEDYFLYFEEIDWSYRNNGRFKLAWSPNAFVYHKEGRAIGTNSRGRPSNTSLYYFNLNFLRFTRKFNPHLLPFALFKVIFVGAIRYLSRDPMGWNTIKAVLVDFKYGVTKRGKI